MNFKKLFLIFGGIVSLIVITVIAVVAILTAQKQTLGKPAAPTVPQIKPNASEPTTTPACTTTFTVAALAQLKCTGVTVSPTSTTITSGSDIRSLTAAATGGTAPIAFTWVITSDGAGKGSLSSITGAVVTWSPPASANLTATQTWSITATATDATGKTDSGNCSVTLNFTKQTTTYQHKVCLGNACSSVQCSPATSACADSCSSNADCGTTPPVTPPAASHRECRNNACVAVTGAGADTCTSDVSCQPKAVAPPIPRSGSTEITIGSIILGVGAIIVGLLLAL